MRKIFAFVLALALVLSLSVSALAVTPAMKIPNVPNVSSITFKVNLGNGWANYFAKNPIKINTK